MKERKTLNKVNSKHKKTIKTAIWVILTIVVFISGYLVAWCSIKPLSDSQFESCEQIARDVYDQKINVIGEVPEEFSVNIAKNTITVSLASSLRKGNVIAKLQNGELVITRYTGNFEAVLLSVVMGSIFVFGEYNIASLVGDIHKKIRERHKK